MKIDKKQKWVDVKDLNPIQQHYIGNVMFLQRLSKTSFGEVPLDLFDDLFLSMYGKNIEGTIKDWDKKFKTLKQ